MPLEPPRSASDEDLRSSIYAELRRLAGRHMQRQPGGHVLEPTALVHEAWLKLVRSADESYRSRTHFLALASRVMRQVLVDQARLRAADGVHGDPRRVTLSGIAALDGAGEKLDLQALHAVLEDLARLSPQSCRLVEMRFLGGMTEAEVAAELGVSRASVTRQWRFARAWLLRRLGGAEGDAP